MKIIQVEQNSPEWFAARVGKIGGSGVSDLISKSGPTKDLITEKLTKLDLPFKKSDTKATLLSKLPVDAIRELNRALPKKLGFYDLVAQSMAYEPMPEDRMERGHRLEAPAREAIGKEVGITFEEQGIWASDDDERITVSPDGADETKTKACEIKCLSNARHIKALIEKEYPQEYFEQALQYFVTNEKLEVLYFTLFNPCVVGHELVYFEIKREDILEQIEEQKTFQLEVFKQVDELLLELTF